MSSPRFASPTFLLRDLRGAQLADAFARIAKCGFDGLELYGMFGLSARELRATAAPAAPAAGNLDATARQSLAGTAADLAPGKTDEDELKPHLTL